MQDEWAMDALEEEQAKSDAVKQATATKVQDDKRIQREKRKAQADARKKQRKAAAEQATVNAALEDERFGPGAVVGYGVFNQPSPSPLRHATAYDPGEGSVEFEHSPAPTFASYGEFPGNQSEYNSETHNDDMELEQELEAFVNGGPDTPA